MAGVGVFVLPSGGDRATGPPFTPLGPNDMACRGPDVDLSWPGYVACQATIVEGSVLKVEPDAGKGRRSVTLKVSRWIKPNAGASTTTLDIRFLGTDRGGGLDVGDRYLFALSKCPDRYTDIWEAPGIARPRQLAVEATAESAKFEDMNPVCW